MANPEKPTRAAPWGWEIRNPDGQPLAGTNRRTREEAIKAFVERAQRVDTRRERVSRWDELRARGYTCEKAPDPNAPDDPGADLDSGPLRTIKPSAGTPSVSRAALRAAVKAVTARRATP
jgi:hypothetical protein